MLVLLLCVDVTSVRGCGVKCDWVRRLLLCVGVTSVRGCYILCVGVTSVRGCYILCVGVTSVRGCGVNRDRFRRVFLCAGVGCWVSIFLHIHMCCLSDNNYYWFCKGWYMREHRISY